MNYDVTLDGQNYRVDITRLDEGGLLIVKVGTQSFTIKAVETDDGTWCVNDGSTDYTVKVAKKNGRQVQIDFNGERREIEWDRVRETHTSGAPSLVSKSTGPKLQGGVYPPMPGKITEVSVTVGDKVKAGTTVCILEAMKMFNELKAPSSGTVKEVHVESGSAVTPNDLLILIG
jgi:biotin carboxyl carrier protein